MAGPLRRSILKWRYMPRIDLSDEERAAVTAAVLRFQLACSIRIGVLPDRRRTRLARWTATVTAEDASRLAAPQAATVA